MRWPVGSPVNSVLFRTGDDATDICCTSVRGPNVCSRPNEEHHIKYQTRRQTRPDTCSVATIDFKLETTHKPQVTTSCNIGPLQHTNPIWSQSNVDWCRLGLGIPFRSQFHACQAATVTRPDPQIANQQPMRKRLHLLMPPMWMWMWMRTRMRMQSECESWGHRHCQFPCQSTAMPFPAGQLHRPNSQRTLLCWLWQLMMKWTTTTTDHVLVSTHLAAVIKNECSFASLLYSIHVFTTAFPS